MPTSSLTMRAAAVHCRSPQLSADYRDRFAEEEIPVGYWVEPEDLAALVVFLASPEARYIAGTPVMGAEA